MSAPWVIGVLGAWFLSIGVVVAALAIIGGKK